MQSYGGFGVERHTHSLLVRCLVGLAAILVALALTMLIPFVREKETYIFFLGAVSFASWYGGRGPGLLASLAGAFAQNYFLSEPVYALSYSVEALVPLFMFMGVSFMICSLRGQAVRSEVSAQEQRRLLEITLASIGDAVIATDINDCVTFMNPVAETLTGYPAGAALGKSSEEVFKISERDGLEKFHNALVEVFRQNRTVNLPTELTLSGRDGKFISIEGNAAPIRDKKGQTVGAVLVFRDVTERVESRNKIVEYQQRLRSLALEVSLAAERERRAIATGLHDRVGQALGLTCIKLGDLGSKLSDATSIAKVDDIRKLMKTIIAEIRSVTFELSPPILYEFGLEAALEWLTTTVHKQHNLRCEFRSTGGRSPLRQEFNVVLFQIVRELLTNVVKHAHAKSASVEIEHNAKNVTLRVIDDGTGFDSSTVVPGQEKSGFGLFSIRERISHIGGTFCMDSQQGRGSSAALVLPV